MTEALEDLQDSTSRLEAENRTLKKASSPIRRTGASGSGGSAKVGDFIIFVRAAEVTRGMPKLWLPLNQKRGLLCLHFASVAPVGWYSASGVLLS